jgi:hypothetical protein
VLRRSDLFERSLDVRTRIGAHFAAHIVSLLKIAARRDARPRRILLRRSWRTPSLGPVSRCELV